MNTQISSLIEDQLPGFIVSEYENFKKVLEFLEHLETVSNSITYIHESDMIVSPLWIKHMSNNLVPERFDDISFNSSMLTLVK